MPVRAAGIAWEARRALLVQFGLGADPGPWGAVDDATRHECITRCRQLAEGERWQHDLGLRPRCETPDEQLAEVLDWFCLASMRG